MSAFNQTGQRVRTQVNVSESDSGLIDDMLSALQNAEAQIEYLQNKFQETGTGNATLAQIRLAAARAERRLGPHGE